MKNYLNIRRLATKSGNPVRVFMLLLGLLFFIIGLTFTAAQSSQVDPFASNNALYPAQKDLPDLFNGYRLSNYRFPAREPHHPTSKLPWRTAIDGEINTKNASAYVNSVKTYLEFNHINQLIDQPLTWSPAAAGWYDMPWGGQGTLQKDGTIDPSSGRESLLGSYSGQRLLPSMYPSANIRSFENKYFQNHSVSYYNDIAAFQLGKIWKNPFKPDITSLTFPEGSVVIKVEGVTLREDQWSALKNSPVSYVYRPRVASLNECMDNGSCKAEVTPIRFLQLGVKVKDKIASPKTGWVYMAFSYDSDNPAPTPWGRTIPVGAMWGNDPILSGLPNGGSGNLQQTWVNNYWKEKDNGSNFVTDSFGWGGRLAGPLDLAVRENVILAQGPSEPVKTLEASACLSCHSTAQYPRAANLYPSPNMIFPSEKGKFLLYNPGSSNWRLWFRNLSPTMAFSSLGGINGFTSADYDLMLTFALARATS